VIAAHDESANIEACIVSVEWAGEVIVVENDSLDDTADLAKGAGATVISPPFTTIGAARNQAIVRAKTPWILVLDADERCTPELAQEIQDKIRTTKLSGVPGSPPQLLLRQGDSPRRLGRGKGQTHSFVPTRFALQREPGARARRCPGGGADGRAEEFASSLHVYFS